MSVRRTAVVWVFAAAGIGATLYVRQQDRNASPVIISDRMLISRSLLPIDDVNRVRVARADGTVVAFERSGLVEWMQVEPLVHRVEAYSIRQLMVQALELQVTDAIAPDELGDDLSAKTLELEPARARVTFDWPGGSLTLSCGRRGLAGRAYVRIDDDETVYVVGQEFHQRAVNDDPREWRDRRIFTNIDASVQRITLRNGENITQLQRARRDWALTQPLDIAADPVACDALLQGLAKAQSQGFLIDQPEDLDAFGLEEPAASIEVETVTLEETGGQITRHPEFQKLLIGPGIGGSQDRFAMVDGGQAIFRVTPQMLATLLPSAQQLADPTATTVHAPDVQSLLIRAGGNEFQLQRDLEKWTAPGFGGASVVPSLVEELLKQITDVRAPEVQIQDYPLHLEVATITLHGSDSRPMTTVRIAKDPDTLKWALENGDNVLRVFPPSMVIHLSPEDYGLSR